MSECESTSRETTLVSPVNSTVEISTFASALERKLNKPTVCGILQQELKSDIDDGRIKMFRIVLVCVYKKNNRKSKSTLSTDVMLLESNTELMYETSKALILSAQENFRLSKPQHEFNEIFSSNIEILTLYTL